MPLLKNIQSKSAKEKRKLLWIMVGSSAIIIFALWILIFPKEYLEKKEDQKSLGDLKDEFKNNEENKQFDEYMDSLEIFKEFDESLNIENLIEETQDTNLSPENNNQNFLEEEKNIRFNRLPLEIN